MNTAPRSAAIVPAAGSGTRMGLARPKQFLSLAGKPILVHTVRALALAEELDAIVLVAPADQVAQTEALVREYRLTKVLAVVPGGRRRQDSVRAGLDSLPHGVELILVHDGVRPFVTPDLVRECLDQARTNGAALAAVPVKDTLKAVDRKQRVMRTVDREGLWQAQTPQVARRGLLEQAFVAAEERGATCTDEAALLEAIGAPVTVVPGLERNIKITRPEDLRLAEALMEEQHLRPGQGLRVGHGYDVHRLGPDRDLVLGGVIIPHALGLVGHSDADVLTHALCDAILGALGQGDIGRHFPDTDPAYRNIRSLRLLEQVMALAADQGYVLVNADITVVAQRPRLAEYLEGMEANLATACRVTAEVINCKATTTEELGFAGREEGIAAHAVVLLQQGQGRRG